MGGVEERGERGWRRRLQESKLGDFEFQSIKLLAFRRAVVAATAAVLFAAVPLPLPLSLSLLALFLLSYPFLFFSLCPIRPPSFFPVFSLPPASNGSFAAEIHTDVSPTPSRTPHSSFSSFLPPAFPPSPLLFPPRLSLPALLCRGSSFATHESARIHTRARAVARFQRSLAYTRRAESTARRDSTTFYCRQTERANGRKGERWPDVAAKTKTEGKRG